MKVTVPTLYEQRYVEPGRRTEIQAWFAGACDVEIAEVPGGLAPVMHVAGERPASKEAREGVPPFGLVSGAPPRIRQIDGLRYVERGTVDEFAASLAAGRAGNLFTGSYRSAPVAGLCGTVTYGRTQESPWKSREELEKAKGKAMRKWIDDYPATASALARRAESLAIVDGSVYERCSEPALTLFFSAEASCVRLGLTEAARHGRRDYRGPFDGYRPGACIRFGLDEAERAREEGMRLADRHGWGFEDGAVIERVSWEDVRFRGEPELLADRLRMLALSAERAVPAMDLRAARAWHALATAAFERGAATLPAIEAARDFVSADREALVAAASAADRTPAEFHGDLAYAFAAAEDALRLWDSRDGSVNGIEWIGSPGGLCGTATFDGPAYAYEVDTLMEAERLSSELETDLLPMAARACSGQGSMVAVRDEDDRARACLLAVPGPDGPHAEEAVSLGGTQPSAAHAELALRHVTRCLAAAPSEEMELSAFGL